MARQAEQRCGGLTSGTLNLSQTATGGAADNSFDPDFKYVGAGGSASSLLTVNDGTASDLVGSTNANGGAGGSTFYGTRGGSGRVRDRLDDIDRHRHASGSSVAMCGAGGFGSDGVFGNSQFWANGDATATTVVSAIGNVLGVSASSVATGGGVFLSCAAHAASKATGSGSGAVSASASARGGDASSTATDSGSGAVSASALATADANRTATGNGPGAVSASASGTDASSTAISGGTSAVSSSATGIGGTASASGVSEGGGAVNVSALLAGGAGLKNAVSGIHERKVDVVSKRFQWRPRVHVLDSDRERHCSVSRHRERRRRRRERQFDRYFGSGREDLWVGCCDRGERR